jgi:hypothetical protein
MKKQCVVIILAAFLFGVGADIGHATQKRGSSTAASPKPQAPELGSVAQFKEAFQNDQGRIRLVALISPT